MYVCGEQEVGVASGSGWNLWVWLVGVVVRRYIDFIIHVLLIPTSCSLKKKFFVLVPVLFVIKLCIKYFSPQYKHTYGQLRAFHSSHMKAAHNVLYMK